MSRVITSPVKRWPGTVTIQDPIFLPAYVAWKDAVDEAERLRGTPADGAKMTVADAATSPELARAFLPGICACVEKWDIQGLGSPVTPETFPATPRLASIRLLAWLIGSVVEIVTVEEELPNG